MHSTIFAKALLLLTAFSVLQAMEPRLRLGPHELTGELGVVSKYIDQGVTRIDRPSAYASVSARAFNLGLNVDSWMAAERDRRGGLRASEISEVRARLDYLIDIPMVLQILPHYETSWYPAHGLRRGSDGEQIPPSFQQAWDVFNPIDSRKWGKEAHYLGVDAWFLLPWEGTEVGGHFAYDIADNAGWRASIMARQFIQIETLDLAFYQALNGGNNRHRDYQIGLRRHGLTTFEAGATATLPLPLEYLFVSLHAAGHVWVDQPSRDIVQRKAFVVAGLSIQIRINDLGF